MKDKIVKFFNNIKNHAIKLLTKIQSHFIKHKQRYKRVLLVILCVYLVLLALCSIGRCTRKNVISADAFGENTDTYFEVPVVMPVNYSSWITDPSDTAHQTFSCTLSSPLYIRMSRNLDFLGVSSISTGLVEKFIPASTPTRLRSNDFICPLVSYFIVSGSIVETQRTYRDYSLEISYISRMYGSYPSITHCNVIPIIDKGDNFFGGLRVELVNLTDDVSTVICEFRVNAYIPSGSHNPVIPFDFMGYNLSYDVFVSDTYANGYSVGKQAGYNEGYSRGYANGSQTVVGENQFTALMNAIVFVPINVLWNILNFEVLGVNVFMFVTAVITVLVIVWLWGKMK